MNTQDTARIRWACRRGMLELDLLLLPFFEARYSSLSASRQADFINLLEANDPELYAWLMGYEEPTQPEFKELVKLVKSYATSQT